MKLKYSIMLALVLVANSCSRTSPEAVFESMTAAEKKAGVCMVELLSNHQFKLIEQCIRRAVAAYEKDCQKERQLGLLWEAFQRKDPFLEPHFNAYVAAFPDSYVAHMARGVYYIGIAWFKRGSAPISRTSQKQLEGLKKYLRRAEQDLLKVKQMQPGLPHVYAELIIIKMPRVKNKERIKEIAQEGLRHSPVSVSIRLSYLTSLLPRWNGSIEEMEAVVKKTKKHIKDNPALSVVCGRVLAEKGDTYFFNREYSKAIQFYNEALKHGETAFVLCQKSRALLFNGEREGALTCIERAIELRPSYQQLHEMKMGLTSS